MSATSKLWEGLKERVVSPKVDEQKLDEVLRQARASLPTPVFWLLGKAQSGKTSLIRALTGSSRAEIGGGFRPCTRTAQLYPFPSAEEAFLEFLDTRGLGEVDYDPTEDMQVLAGQAHLVIVVIKALDHAQQSVLAALQKILREHPKWPVIVVQTSLHEGYAETSSQHVMPYPYGEYPYGSTVPLDLARSLASQRELFSAYQARFVPVDFTLPEDGFEPEYYGLEPLWSAIEDALPLGLRAMLQHTKPAQRRCATFIFARPIHMCSPMRWRPARRPACRCRLLTFRS